VADLSAFIKAHPVKNPNPPDFEPDGTWYSMVAVGNSLYAVEPNHGELDKITLKGDLMKELGGSFWGRLYFKVLTPMPDPEKVHSTFVAAAAKSPLHQDDMETRMFGTNLGAKGMYSYLFNVQPHTKRPEFGKSSAAKYTYKNEWQLAEWQVDHATQTYRLFIDGGEIKDASFSKGAGNYEGAELPESYESLSFGFTNYQQAGKGFTVWIDDIALAKDRVGTRGIPAAKKK
jgi:hypothetical protein